VTKVCSDGVYYKDARNNRSDATWMPADIVIVNADVPYATETLLRETAESDKEIYDWNDAFDYSSGVVAFHWCVNKRLDELNTHNVFLFSDDRTSAKESWRVLRPNHKKTQDDVDNIEPFNFYVHRPSKTDQSAAPEGCDSLMVLVPCKTLTRLREFALLEKEEAMKAYQAQFSDDFINCTREGVLARLSVLKGLGDLKDSILHESVDTPASYAEYYNVGAGVPFGLVSSLAILYLWSWL